MQRRQFIKLGACTAAASLLANLRSIKGAVAPTTSHINDGTLALTYPYADPDLSIEARIDDLLTRLTAKEKISLLYWITPAIPRLGILKYSLGNEGLHGLVRPGKNTVFPEAIGLGATFNPALIHRMSSAISDEARARWNLEWKNVKPISGTLILWAPVVNMARDPRWGRTQETYGEDPHLTSRMGVAYVKGLQGDDPRYIKVAATLKHFAGYNVETNRFAFNAIASNRYWFEYEFVAYRACVTEANVQSVMGAYNAINGVPCCCNKWLLTDVLRGRWHFDGFVVSDCGAVSNICSTHHYVRTPAEAGAAALNSGLDMEGGWFSKYPNLFNDYLPEALEKKLVTIETIDRALTRILRARFRLGMFDPPARVPYSKIPASVIGCREHIALAREIARESIVLMQNYSMGKVGPILPLNISTLHRIAVVGDAAGKAEFGDYSGVPTISPVTFVNALQQRIARLKYKMTMRWIKTNTKQKQTRVKQGALSDQDMQFIKDADVVFVCITSPYAAEGHDQKHLELDPEQESLVQQVAQVNPHIVTILYTGTAVAIPWIKKNIPAVVNAWYPGEEGGNALADVIFGDYNPAGRLPLTYYAATHDLPPMASYDLYKGGGRTYMYFKGDVLYPFGHGLSYTNFTYSNLRLSGTSFDAHERLISHVLTVQVDVTNYGERDGDEVIQAYIRQVTSVFPQPIRQLKAFSRVHIAKGNTKTVELNMPINDWALWDEVQNSLRVFPGDYEILIGSSSGDIRISERVNIRKD